MIEPDDEQTARARRASPSPSPRTPLPEPADERTTPARRTGRGVVPDPATTAPSSRQAASESETTAVSSRASGAPVSGTADTAPATGFMTSQAAPGPRRVGRADPESAAPAAPADRARRDGPAARRSGTPWASAGDIPGGAGRVAHPPQEGRVLYPARAVPPVTASRAEPVRRDPQPPVDTAGTQAAERRRRRRRAIAVVVAASVLVVIAAIALAVLVAVG